MPDDVIEIEDAKGNRVKVSRAHFNRYPSLAESFRPVAEKKATTVAVKPPTGDEKKEN